MIKTYKNWKCILIKVLVVFDRTADFRARECWAGPGHITGNWRSAVNYAGPCWSTCSVAILRRRGRCVILLYNANHVGPVNFLYGTPSRMVTYPDAIPFLRSWLSRLRACALLCGTVMTPPPARAYSRRGELTQQLQFHFRKIGFIGKYSFL